MLPQEASWSGTPSIKGSTEAIRMLLLTFSMIGVSCVKRSPPKPCTRQQHSELTFELFPQLHLGHRDDMSVLLPRIRRSNRARSVLNRARCRWHALPPQARPDQEPHLGGLDRRPAVWPARAARRRRDRGQVQVEVGPPTAIHDGRLARRGDMLVPPGLDERGGGGIRQG